MTSTTAICKITEKKGFRKKAKKLILFTKGAVLIYVLWLFLPFCTLLSSTSARSIDEAKILVSTQTFENVFLAEKCLHEIAFESRILLNDQEWNEISDVAKTIDLFYQEKLLLANTLFKEKKYAESLEITEKLLISAKKGLFPRTRMQKVLNNAIETLSYRLSCLYYLLGEYEKASEQAQSSTESRFPQLALLAMSYEKLGKNIEALNTYDQFLKRFPNSTHALLGKAFVAIKCHKFSVAKNALHSCSEKASIEQKEKLLFLRVYLAIIEDKLDSAKQLLPQIEPKTELGHAQKQFLQAVIHVKGKNYEKAIYLLEDVASKHFEKLRIEALHLLAISYKALAQRTAQTAAQETVQESEQDNGSAFLQRAKECAKECRKESSLFPEDEEENEKTLRLKLDRHSSRDNNYPQILFAYGKKAHAQEYVAKAFMQEINNKKLRESFCFLTSCIEWLSKDHPQKALELIEILSEESKESPEMLKECLYLKGIVYYFKEKEYEKMALMHETMQSLYPESIRVSELAHLLGIKAYKKGFFQEAKHYLSAVVEKNPDFFRRDEALFYLAKVSKNAKEYYQELIMTYPDSQYADEAYFHMFDESEYARLSARAILHLKKSPYLSKHSLFSTISKYYIAKNMQEELPEKNPTPIQYEQLIETKKLFDSVQKEAETFNAIPKKMQQALQECGLFSASASAKISLTLAMCGNKSKEAFDETIFRFSQLKKMVEEKYGQNKKALFLSLWQEASWLISRSYKMIGKEPDAILELKQLAEFSKKMNFFSSESCILGLCELSSNAVRKKHYEESSQIIDLCDKALKSWPHKEMQLVVWLAKSELAKAEKKLDRAMAYLSQIINDDTASSLRLEAMYHRAEIYELKGRRDLALRQLEAVKKKGGHWADMAKIKLEVQYGYE